MTKLSAIALVAALAAAAPAYALDATVKAGAATTAGATVGGTEAAAGVDATATGSVSADDNYGSLISSLNAGKSMTDFGSVSADTDIAIVNVSSLKASGNTNALDNALEKNKANMTSLHASIEGNAALKAKLDAEKIAIDSVVAVTTSADGKLTVFVDDRA